MTSVMLACYPEVFAGGAIIAGVPYGAASNVQQAFESMFQSPSRSAREWGDLVRQQHPMEDPGREFRFGMAPPTRSWFRRMRARSSNSGLMSTGFPACHRWKGALPAIRVRSG